MMAPNATTWRAEKREKDTGRAIPPVCWPSPPSGDSCDTTADPAAGEWQWQSPALPPPAHPETPAEQTFTFGSATLAPLRAAGSPLVMPRGTASTPPGSPARAPAAGGAMHPAMASPLRLVGSPQGVRSVRLTGSARLVGGAILPPSPLLAAVQPPDGVPQATLASPGRFEKGGAGHREPSFRDFLIITPQPAQPALAPPASAVVPLPLPLATTPRKRPRKSAAPERSPDVHATLPCRVAVSQASLGSGRSMHTGSCGEDEAHSCAPQMHWTAEPMCCS